MAWIHISTKPFPSFEQADRERAALLPHLAADHSGRDNVKVRIRRRASDRYEVIAWRWTSTLGVTQETVKHFEACNRAHKAGASAVMPAAKLPPRSIAMLVALTTLAGTGGN